MIRTTPRKLTEKEIEMEHDVTATQSLFEEIKSSVLINGLDFAVNLNAKGKKCDSLRRSKHVPFHRARTIMPDELRKMQNDQFEKLSEIRNLIIKNDKNELLNYLKANSECEHILKYEAMQSLKVKFRILENGSAKLIFDYISLSIEAFGKQKLWKLASLKSKQ